MALDQPTRAATEELIEALQPLAARARAMFGGYCFYVDDKVVGLVCDGRVFVKTSPRDELLRGWADLAPAYPEPRTHGAFRSVHSGRSRTECAPWSIRSP